MNVLSRYLILVLFLVPIIPFLHLTKKTCYLYDADNVYKETNKDVNKRFGCSDEAQLVKPALPEVKAEAPTFAGRNKSKRENLSFVSNSVA